MAAGQQLVVAARRRRPRLPVQHLPDHVTDEDLLVGFGHPLRDQHHDRVAVPVGRHGSLPAWAVAAPRRAAADGGAVVGARPGAADPAARRPDGCGFIGITAPRFCTRPTYSGESPRCCSGGRPQVRHERVAARAKSDCTGHDLGGRQRLISASTGDMHSQTSRQTSWARGFHAGHAWVQPRTRRVHATGRAHPFHTLVHTGGHVAGTV